MNTFYNVVRGVIFNGTNHQEVIDQYGSLLEKVGDKLILHAGYMDVEILSGDLVYMTTDSMPRVTFIRADSIGAGLVKASINPFEAIENLQQRMKAIDGKDA
ncbi:hypothetical protein ACQV2B_18945 [Pantoea allii]|uniref:hypothetical protein n=1 Tax=Pantoea allii TaxID=574096 RepID=UPI003D318F9F